MSDKELHLSVNSGISRLKGGLSGIIASAFGCKKQQEPVYLLPPEYFFPVMPASQPAKKQKHDHWAEMKKRWDDKMEFERERRSKYGGF